MIMPTYGTVYGSGDDYSSMVTTDQPQQQQTDQTTFGNLDDNWRNFTTETTAFFSDTTGVAPTETILFSDVPGGAGRPRLINVTGGGPAANLPRSNLNDVVEQEQDRLLLVGIITGAVGLLLGVMLTATMWMFLRRKRDYRRRKKGPEKNPKEMTFEELDLTLVHGNYDTPGGGGGGGYQDEALPSQQRNLYQEQRTSNNQLEIEQQQQTLPRLSPIVNKHRNNSSNSVFCPIDIHVGSYQSFESPSPPPDDLDVPMSEYSGSERAFMPYQQNRHHHHGRMAAYQQRHDDEIYTRSVSQENDLGTGFYQYPASRSHANDNGVRNSSSLEQRDSFSSSGRGTAVESDIYPYNDHHHNGLTSRDPSLMKLSSSTTTRNTPTSSEYDHKQHKGAELLYNSSRDPTPQKPARILKPRVMNGSSGNGATSSRPASADEWCSPGVIPTPTPHSSSSELQAATINGVIDEEEEVQSRSSLSSKNAMMMPHHYDNNTNVKCDDVINDDDDADSDVLSTYFDIHLPVSYTKSLASASPPPPSEHSMLSGTGAGHSRTSSLSRYHHGSRDDDQVIAL